MISEEDKKLIAEAKSCDSCLKWHKHCQAECCKYIFLNIFSNEYYEADEFIKIKEIVLPSMQRYFSYRGVRYNRGVLLFKKSRVIRLHDGRFVYVFPCNMLDKELKCKVHGKNKPSICVSLDDAFIRNGHPGVAVTENCMYKYKVMEE